MYHCGTADATLCGIEFAMRTSATSARFEMAIRRPESEDDMERSCKRWMDDDRLAKIARNGKPNISSHVLQNVDAKVGTLQENWIKYKTRSYKKMKKKKKKMFQ